MLKDLVKLIINLPKTIVNINFTHTERFEISSQTLQKDPKAIMFVGDVQLFVRKMRIKICHVQREKTTQASTLDFYIHTLLDMI